MSTPFAKVALCIESGHRVYQASNEGHDHFHEHTGVRPSAATLKLLRAVAISRRLDELRVPRA